MEKTAWLLLCILATSSGICEGAKILVIFPLAGKSHDILGRGIVRHLLNAGHEVTYVTALPKNVTHPKHTEIDISSVEEDSEGSWDFFNLQNVMDYNLGEFLDQTLFILMMPQLGKATMMHKNVQKLMKDPEQHFDLVIAEWMFCELYAGFAAVFNAPLIWSSSMEPHWMILNLVDDYTNPAYVGYVVDANPPFSFYERTKELWSVIKMSTARETIALYLQTKFYNEEIAPIIEAKGRKAPYFSELRYNASLVLGNSHLSMGHPTTVPEIYKAIGGYHIEEKVQPLPENLKKLLDNAKDGLIYFSLGSNIQSKDMPDKLKRSLLDMFGTLKQTVLWKFEDKLDNLPKNVHIIQWAPQQSILAHPNCILFITHGGQLSTTETIFAGKPVIGVPIFADQFPNVARAVAKGYGLRVKLDYDMADKLNTAIEEILGNPKYAQRAKELSFIYHHRLVTPGQELVHWVDHVIQTKGALHLRSPALMVPWYQKYFIDLAAIIIVVILVLKRVATFLLSLRKPKVKQSSKKNN